MPAPMCEPDFAPSGWVERRVLPAGDWRVGKADGMRAEQLVERADGRPSWLVSVDELPIGENEAEPGGESFGLTTLIGRSAGLRRIGVNLDVVHPGQRSARYHWHRSEEEGFLVLGGTGWLYAGDERFRVGPGDFFAKTEGPEAARTSSSTTARPTCASSRSASTARTTRSNTPRRPGCPRVASSASDRSIPAQRIRQVRASGVREHRVRDVEVEVDVLDVVALLERVDQPQQRAGLVGVDLDLRLGQQREVGALDRDPASSSAARSAGEVVRLGRDQPHVAVLAHVLRAAVGRGERDRVLVDGRRAAP